MASTRTSPVCRGISKFNLVRLTGTLQLLSHSICYSGHKNVCSGKLHSLQSLEGGTVTFPVLWGLVLTHTTQDMAVGQVPREGSGRKIPLWEVGVTLAYLWDPLLQIAKDE